MNKPKTLLPERKKKKLEDLKKKIHLEIAYYQMELGICRTFNEYISHTAELINSAMDGLMRIERPDFKFTTESVQSLREKLEELTTYDNLGVEDQDTDEMEIPYELIDH